MSFLANLLSPIVVYSEGTGVPSPLPKSIDNSSAPRHVIGAFILAGAEVDLPSVPTHPNRFPVSSAPRRGLDRQARGRGAVPHI